MKAYLVTTGLLFVIVVVAHVLRVTQESHLARDPWFIFTTVAATALALWALRLFRQTARQ
jgi:hypothetical protein